MPTSNPFSKQSILELISTVTGSDMAEPGREDSPWTKAEKAFVGQVYSVPSSLLAQGPSMIQLAD